ncbi:MAG: hypothetical protein IMZ62_03685 [Chloroflexi bacterium]|nr:hypothetical protein [Chloroflexota bacterium]
MAFSGLLTTEMPLLFSDWLPASARLLAEPLYGGVIGRRTELVLIPSGQGRMRIISPHELLPAEV